MYSQTQTCLSLSLSHRHTDTHPSYNVCINSYPHIYNDHIHTYTDAETRPPFNV